MAEALEARLEGSDSGAAEGLERRGGESDSGVSVTPSPARREEDGSCSAEEDGAEGARTGVLGGVEEQQDSPLHEESSAPPAEQRPPRELTQEPSLPGENFVGSAVSAAPTFSGFVTPIPESQQQLTPGDGWRAQLQGNVTAAAAARSWAGYGDRSAGSVHSLSPYELSSAGTSSMAASLRRSHKKVVKNSIRGELHNLMRGMELVVLSASFDGWRRMLQHSRAMLEVACNAWVTLFHKRIRASFLTWFASSQEAIVSRRKMLACLARMRLRLISRSWTSWWSYCQRRKLATLLLNRLRITFRLRRLKGCLAHWRMVTINGRINRRLLSRPLKRMMRRRLSESFFSWVDWDMRNRHRRKLIERATARLHARSISLAWGAWVEQAGEQQRQRSVCAKVVARWERGATWRGFGHLAAVTLEKKQERVAVGRFRRRLRLGTLRHTVEVWEWWLQERLHMHIVFRGWLDTVRSALVKRRKQGVSAWKMALSSRVGGSFQCWRIISEEKVILKRLTQRAVARLVHTRLWRCVCFWQEWVKQNLRVRNILNRAVGKLRSHALWMAWDAWIGRAEKQKHYRVAVGRCRRRIRRSFLRRTIKAWGQWLQERRYIGSVFRGWVDAVRTALRLRREQGLRAWKMAFSSRVGGAFQSWQCLATELATRKCLIRRCLARLVERLLWQHFHAWSNFASQCIYSQRIVKKAISKLCLRTRSSAWAAWVERVREQKRLRGVCAMAVTRWERAAVWRSLELWAAVSLREKQARVAVGRCRRRLRLAVLRRSTEAWITLAQRRARERAVTGRCRWRLEKMLKSSVLEHWRARLRARRIARRAINMAGRRCLCEAWCSWVGVVRELKRQGRVAAKIVGRLKRAIVWRAFISWVLWLENNRLAEEMAARMFGKIWSESIAADKRRLKVEKLFYVTQERSVHWFKLAFVRQWVQATENMQVFRGIFSSWWIFARREAYREEQLRRKVGLWRMKKVVGWWQFQVDRGNRKKAILRRASRKWRGLQLSSAWRSWMACIHARAANIERSFRLLRILALKDGRFRVGAAFDRWCSYVQEKQRDTFRLRRAVRAIWDSRLRYSLRAWSAFNLRRRVLKIHMKNLFAARSIQCAKLYLRQWRSLWVTATWDSERLMSRTFSSWLQVLWAANKERNLKLRYSLFAQSNEDKLAAVTKMMKCIKFSLIEMISELRSDLRKSSREIQRLTVAEYSKQWQVTIAKEKHQVKHFVACKLEENAAILVCDILEQAEACMKTIEGHTSLNLKQFSYLDMGGAQPWAAFEDFQTESIIQAPTPVLWDNGIAQASLPGSVGYKSGDGAESDFSLLQSELLVRHCFERWRSKPSQDVFLLAFLEIRRARASFQQLSRAQLRELQSMPKPPKVVRLALEALCTMLNGWSHTNWDGIRRSLQSEKFSLTVLRYSGKNLTEDLIQFLEEKYLSLPELSEENVAKASRACAPLINLIVSHVRFKKLSLRFGGGNS